MLGGKKQKGRGKESARGSTLTVQGDEKTDTFYGLCGGMLFPATPNAIGSCWTDIKFGATRKGPLGMWKMYVFPKHFILIC